MNGQAGTSRVILIDEFRPLFRTDVPLPEPHIPRVLQGSSCKNHPHRTVLAAPSRISADDRVFVRAIAGCGKAWHRLWTKVGILLGTETFPDLGELTRQARGFAKCARHAMNSFSPGEAFCTVAVMTATFLIEVAFFVLIGVF